MQQQTVDEQVFEERQLLQQEADRDQIRVQYREWLRVKGLQDLCQSRELFQFFLQEKVNRKGNDGKRQERWFLHRLQKRDRIYWFLMLALFVGLVMGLVYNPAVAGWVLLVLCFVFVPFLMWRLTRIGPDPCDRFLVGTIPIAC